MASWKAFLWTLAAIVLIGLIIWHAFAETFSTIACLRWYPGRDSNPQSPDFKTGSYTSSLNRGSELSGPEA